MKRINNNTTKQRKAKRVWASASPDLRLNDIMPPAIYRSLEYIDSNYTRANTGANFLAYTFRTNDLFDPDPLILSGSVSGFKEIMTFYNNFKVIDFEFKLMIANNENFPVIWGVVFSNTNLVGGFSNRDDAVNALENNFSTRARILGAKGGIDQADIHEVCAPWKLFGDKKNYLGESAYAGTVVSSPANLTFMTLIIASPSASLLANGVTTALTLTYGSKFYSRTNIRA